MPAFIQLRSGAFLDLENPAPRLITLADIAYATARICRYTGHTSRHTSVAEHSVHVSLICPPEVAYEALLHDAAEAYVGDVSGPLKRLLPDFVVVEQRMRAAIAERFGLGSVWPCKRRAGLTFRRWVAKMRSYGYAVEWRNLVAADYGSPTTRKRLFLVARCDGEPIVWPSATHGSARAPYRTAAECIDWTLPVPSIFDRKRPLADATLKRIARGVQRFVLDAAEPFVVPLTHQGDSRVYGLGEPFRTVTCANRGEMALVSPSLIQTSYGEREGQAPRVLDVQAPLGTVVAGGQKHALVAAFLAKHFGGHESPGASLTLPLSTVTARDHHALVTATANGERREDVRAFLTKFYGTSTGQSLQLSMPTVTSEGQHLGVVTVHGHRFVIADIGMRLLEPHELAAAQGFPPSYSLDAAPTKTARIRLIGNSVCSQVAEAIVAANVGREAKRGAA